MIYLTSDHHFGHKNIITYCDRPFSNVVEMDTELVTRWNRVVQADDIVYHLGDFTLGGYQKARMMFRMLNGHIRILAYNWHHDKVWISEMTKRHLPLESATDEVELLSPMVVLEFDKLPPITLCHYPMMQWDRSHYNGILFHGHSHGTIHIPGNALDVGVDEHDFYPISLLDAVEQIETKKELSV